jgi:16S rRNA (cytosine967-C5)-methyltransferase
MKISSARLAAFNILLKIETEKAYSSVLLATAEQELSAVDRALCHELVLGTLRRQMLLDRVIELFTKGKKLDDAVKIAIRLGLYQLRFLDKIPQYSAVNESVGLVQKAGKTSAKSFVNAVLRRATAELPQITFTDETDRVSLETSHPRWLIERWISEFGSDQAEALASANNAAGVLAFRLISDVPVDGFHARPSEFVDGCYLSDRMTNALMAASRRGEVYFQDEGSQMVAAAVPVSTGGNFLDVCAAPGGKTGMVVRRGGQLNFAVAGDLNWRRAVLLQDNCRKQGVAHVNVVQYDAERGLPFADKSFETVLVDAPCSGTGTIRHNPELRYFIKPEDLVELPKKQLQILENASKLVRRGGSLVYSTCSLETEENEMVCRSFLSAAGGFGVVRPNVAERFITDGGYARTFPHRDGMDGFFIAEFRKNG